MSERTSRYQCNKPSAHPIGYDRSRKERRRRTGTARATFHSYALLTDCNGIQHRTPTLSTGRGCPLWLDHVKSPYGILVDVRPHDVRDERVSAVLVVDLTTAQIRSESCMLEGVLSRPKRQATRINGHRNSSRGTIPTKNACRFGVTSLRMTAERTLKSHLYIRWQDGPKHSRVDELFLTTHRIENNKKTSPHRVI